MILNGTETTGQAARPAYVVGPGAYGTSQNSSQGGVFVLILTSWNFTEWFLFLKVDIHWSTKHDKRTVRKSRISRNKGTKLSFSRTDRSWVKQRITAIFVVFDFFRCVPEQIRLQEGFCLIPRAIPHGIKLFRNIETQNRRLKSPLHENLRTILRHSVGP